MEKVLRKEQPKREFVFIENISEKEFQKVKEEITLFFKKRAFGTFSFIIYTIIVLTII
jgi:hypothetical protein